MSADHQSTTGPFGKRSRSPQPARAGVVEHVDGAVERFVDPDEGTYWTGYGWEDHGGARYGGGPLDERDWDEV